MKNVLIAAKNLKIGGIEKSLITLTDFLVDQGYDISLVLEEKEGELLKELNSQIKIIEYKPCFVKYIIARKIINFYKRIKFRIKYNNRFDVAISYATYSKPSSYVARCASNNSILWCHANYLELYKGDKNKVRKFFEDIHYDEFQKIVFVAKSALNSFSQVFPEQKNLYFCNNLIDSGKIYEMSRKSIRIKYSRDITTFLNVGRHDESQKRLSRIIKAAYMLKKEKYDFRIIFVGDGNDRIYYEKMVKKYNLQRNIFFEGAKKNPYPYFKIADCTIISSDYEGYPVVFLESFLFNIPIITTDISDFIDVQNGRGMVASKSTKGIYKAMKQFLEKGYNVKNKFSEREYNKKVKNKIKEILEK